METVISYASTYFVFRAAVLLRRYPRTTLSKEWSAATQALVTVLSALALAAAADHSGIVSFLMRTIDVLTGAAAAILMGYYIVTFRSRNPGSVRSDLRRRAARWAAFLTYALWGLSQVPNLLMLAMEQGWVHSRAMEGIVAEPAGLYFMFLMILKLLCAMSTVIFAILFIKDKPPFQDVVDGAPRGA
jgi:hypothetical protein